MKKTRLAATYICMHTRIPEVRFIHLSVQAPRPQQRGIQGVRAVGGHQHLDVAPGVEAVELRHDLEHGALDLVVPTAVVPPRSTPT